MTPILLAGAIVGLGLTLIVAVLLPQQPHLAAAIQRLGSTTADATATPRRREERLGAWVHARVPDLPGVTIPTRDLALINMPVNEFFYLKARNAVLLLVLPSLLGLLFQALDILPAFIPAVLGLPLALVGWISIDREVRQKAAVAREEFSRAIAVYLELVAAERRRDAPIGHALETAASVGQSWVFVRIGEELTRARYAGMTPWDALDNFSDEVGVPELSDLAKIARLSGEGGASIYETLKQRGRSLRVQLLNNEQTKANEVSERMSSIPLVALGFVFIGIVMTPFLLRLVSA